MLFRVARDDPAMDLRVGTCGYRYYDGDLGEYAAEYGALELNSTFYSLPGTDNLRERREAVADEDLAVAVKGWQALTHTNASPTWNGERDGVADWILEDCGALRDNEAVREAWARTRDHAEAFDADAVLLQTPPSFDCTDEHAANMRGLLGEVDRDGLTLAWEPRGDWPGSPDRIADLCADLDLAHVVDPLHDEPLDDSPVAYFRLHGEGDVHDYSYDYDDEELDALASALEAYEDRERVYCLFNNDAMFDNARALLDRV